MEDEPLDEHVPRFICEGIDASKMEISRGDPEIMLIDFGEAYIVDDEEKCEDFANNLAYASPETVIFGERATQASDVWALALIIYEMRSGEMLISEGMGQPGMVQNEMMTLVGDLPPVWLERILENAWAEGMEIIDDDYVGTGSKPTFNDEVGMVEERNDEPSAADEPDIKGGIRGRLRKGWNWIASFFREAVGSHEEVHTDNSDGTRDDTLASRVGAIGRWNKWCYMTKEERLSTFNQFRKSSGDIQEDDGEDVPWHAIEMSSPPPPPLLPLEKEDLTNLLSPMLKFMPEARATLDSIKKHPYFEGDHFSTLDKDSPWLEDFQRELQLWRYEDGRKIIYC